MGARLLEGTVRTLDTTFTVLKRVIRPSVSKVSLCVTYDCNQYCKTCNVRTNKLTPSSRSEEMTLKEIQDFAKISRPIWINLTGGEPFLRPDFKHIMEAVASIPTLKFLPITSNGSMVEKMEEDLRYLGSRNKKLLGVPIQISFEGPESLQAEITGVKDSYEKAKLSLEMVTRLSKEYPQIRPQISYTLSKFNSGKLRDLLVDLGSSCPPLDRIVLGVAFNSSYYRTDKAPSVAPNTKDLLEEISWFKKQLLTRSRFDPVSLLLIRSYLNKVSESFSNNGARLGCVAGKFDCVVDPYWNVSPCSYLFDLKLGNLRDYGYNIQDLMDDTRPIWGPKVASCMKEGHCRSICEIPTMLLFKPWRIL